ncbi:MAG: hypothetical protein EBS90_13115, partial [Betaproteobacteria bacterium]|nr:hypothetical protein [Betaproteobacteria bacterium]
YLWKADLSGPSQRFVLAQAQRRFDEISQAVITQMVSRVRLWALAKAIKRGDLTPPAGMDRWWQAVYHTPQRTTIDAGRDSAADREDFKLGIRTLADIAAERGDDWQEIVDQRVAEQAYIRQKAAEAGVDLTEIQNTGKPAVPAVTPPSAPPADEAPAQTPAPELAAATESKTVDAPVLTESFTMRDDPDFTLTKKEADMVVKAIGIGAKSKTKKKK